MNKNDFTVYNLFCGVLELLKAINFPSQLCQEYSGNSFIFPQFGQKQVEAL